MLHIKENHLVLKLPGLLLPPLFSVALLCSGMTGAGTTHAAAQKRSSARAAATVTSTADKTNGEEGPIFSEYKGVRIGMMMDEARQKMGNPQDKSDEQDFYVFNDKESAQVFYDKTHKTYAISINYLGTGGSTPTPKDVLGSEIEAKPDGSMYKMMRYPKAGFWVSYSRTAGNDPLVTVTLQRID
ncbi:MAG TPA: hypothetical protein VGX92_01420 [Pyrinomonadaceae bacterium]|jgi:hypothetical protein|nr:hypothetical protein [Pyrinomonadaceae bacterium]